MSISEPAAGADLLAQVTVLVVTYNSSHCIAALAAGLRALPYLIVVDNASQDDTCAAVRAQLPHATLLQLPANRGFGVANNEGLARVQTPFALLLNPDCLIAADAIAALVDAARQWPDATLLVPQLLDGAGRRQLNYSWPRHCWRPRGGASEGALNVGFACAAAMLINLDRLRAVLADGPGFDPRFFLYYEDEDLCLRVFQRRGQILVLPEITAVHHARGSVRGARPWRAEYWRGFHHAQSKVRFVAKHFGAAAARRARRRLLGTATANLLARTLLLSPKHLARAWGRLRGVWQLGPEAA
ncbi:MAG: dTDP-Rha:A-D-GlcNAc-diphosphoryl polyprenol, A-3-L-rhamnosyl transferase WbbL [Burkholderiaceae bacterium]|nr:MAG: dTDP-Rha:A-D-GlcNAc-diphosphoryl polyprenol, A-3-L-rhamnosyl transferase WbbL [Burkholderiaceae bacterium]